MANDLDDILVSMDCPHCRADLSVPYGQIRLYRAAGCSCGALIKIEDDTYVAAIQALIDEANPIIADND